MIRLGERPWDGTFSHAGRWLDWVEEEPLWDGTPVWRLRDRPTPSIFASLLSRVMSSWMTETVSWLEDEAWPVAGNDPAPGA